MKTSMSSLPLFAVAFSLIASLFPSAALGETTASSKPVELKSVTIPAAVDESTPAKTALSIPLYRAPDFTGPVASVDGSDVFTLSLGGAVWTANQFADAAAPRLVRVKVSATASHVGQFFLVAGNSAGGQLQVVLPSGASTVAALVSVGDVCEVLPANTLGSLFGTGSTVFATGATSATSDNLQLFNGTSWDTYFHNGTSWVKDGDATAASQDNEIVYPDEGIFVCRRLTSTVALTLAGTAPATAEKSALAGAVGTTRGTTFLANRFPVGTTLDGLALQNTSNWTSSGSVSNADNVLLWSGTAWVTYYFNGSIWRQAATTENKGATAIPVNTAVQVTRRSTSRSFLLQALPYTP